MKTELDDSFEILARNRKLLHQRRTVSSVMDISNTSIHNKSFSSQLPNVTEELQNEIQKIKDEVKARCIEQQRREMIFESIIAGDFALQTEEVQIEPIDELCEDSARNQRSYLCYALSCILKCLKIEK
jgi:hypothetical protein